MYKYFTCLLVSLSLLLVRLYAHAGANEANFENQPTIKENRTGQLFLGINTLTFIRNSEYFGPLLQGQTLVGHRIHPYLSYYPAKDIRISGGVFTRRDWADVHFFSKLYPTFTIQYEDQALSLILGNIEAKTGHGLIKPLYNLERGLLRGPESGLQIRYIQSHTFIDVWLEWLSLLCKESGRPEELGAGLSFHRILLQNSWIQLGIPIQLLLYHLGGQGISTKDYSLLFGAIGASLEVPISKQDWLRSISFGNYYVASRYMKTVARPFRQGQAFYSQMNFKTAWLDISASYWQGVGFSSENLGDPLYDSIALLNKQVTYQEQFRQLFLLQLSYHYQITDQITLGLQLEPYYDFQNKLFEHSEGLYVGYTPFFKLAENKQSEG
jgi:hypothetical protein